LEKGLDDAEIVIIDDFEDTIPEVGKSTLRYIVNFLHEELDISQTRLVSEVKLGWKTSVYFEDWCGRKLHSPLGKPLPTVTQVEMGRTVEPLARSESLSPENEAVFNEFYYRYQENEFTTLYNELGETPGKTALIPDEHDVNDVQKGLPDASYHFDHRSFNRFLRTICEERGVKLIDDRITEVETDGEYVESIASDDATYDVDLYVDASGFNRLLMGELDVGFREFDLPVDSAVVATTDVDVDEITSATVVTSGDAGWFWQIDTVDVRDLGYVYSSNHISDEEAVEEFVETRDGEIDPDHVRRYRFDSGVLEQGWIGNCVANGNAMGFVEPLQSTALTTSARLAERLATLLGAHGRINHRGLREFYNETTRATWEEIYDFVSLYYRYNDGETAFWEDARAVNPGPIQQVETYHASGFCAPQKRAALTRTRTDLNNYYLYYLVLYGLGVESEFYEDLDHEPDPEVVEAVHEYTDSVYDRLDDFISYREFYYFFHPGFED